MRRLFIFTLVLAFVVPAFAQQADRDEALTKGAFAQLVLEVIATKQAPNLPPDVALQRVMQLELVPPNWLPDDLLVQSELQLVIAKLEIPYQVPDPNAVVSRAYAETLLRRYQKEFRRYATLRVTHGESIGVIVDEGIDRAVSPSEFYIETHG